MSSGVLASRPTCDKGEVSGVKEHPRTCRQYTLRRAVHWPLHPLGLEASLSLLDAPAFDSPLWRSPPSHLTYPPFSPLSPPPLSLPPSLPLARSRPRSPIDESATPTSLPSLDFPFDLNR
eukprot:4456348-Pleurochrysis_carterae.AAC.3